MRIKRALVLFLFPALFLHAQNNPVDSLLQRIKTAPDDTNKIITLCQLAWIESNDNAEACLKHANQAIALSQKLNFLKGISYGHNAIGVMYNQTGNNPKAIEHYHAANQIWVKLNNLERVAKIYSNIGNAYSDIPNFDSASVYYQKSIALCKTHNFKGPLASAYINLASLQINRNNYDAGISYLLQCLKIKEELKDSSGIANVYSNISVLYKEQKRYDKALEYAFDANKIYSQMNNLADLGYSEMGIGMIYYKTKQNDPAEKYFKQALKHFINSEYKIGIAVGYNNLGLIDLDKKNYSKAIENFEKGMANSTNPYVYDSYLTAATNLITCYNATGNLSKAKMYVDSAALHFNNSVQKNQIKNLYQACAEYYTKTSDYKNAVVYYQKLDAIKDSLVAEENSKLTMEIEARFETEKKELQNQELTLKNKLVAAGLEKVSRQRTVITIAAIAFVILVGGFILLFQKIRSSRQKLIRQEEITKATLDSEQNERERIARELHDGVGQKMAVLKMQLSTPDISNERNANLLDNIIHDVRQISHNLMPYHLDKGLIPAVESMAEELNFANPNIKTHLTITNSVKQLDIGRQQTLIIYRIIQEFVNNTIKYANAKNIHISMDCENQQFRLALSDDGVGFDPDKLQNNSGIGIKNIQSRIDQLKGYLKITSNLNNGTNFNIEFKI